jgi:hypothetical protein
MTGAVSTRSTPGSAPTFAATAVIPGMVLVGIGAGLAGALKASAEVGAQPRARSKA